MTSALQNAYFEQIQQLVELQKIDDAIYAANQEKEGAPRDLEELEARFQETETQRERILDKKSHLEAQQKRIDQEIEDDAGRLKKSKNKLMQVANSREYKAMESEMDTMEKISRSRKEERLTLLEELQTQEEAFKAIEGTYQELSAEVTKKRDGMEGRLKKIEKQLESLGKKRHKAAVLIPQPIFQRYEFIRKRLDHPVIVAVSEGVCSGCNIAVPPQTYIELQRGQQILSCPNCQRLIFWADHFQGMDGRAEAAPKQDAAAPEPDANPDASPSTEAAETADAASA
ncbi:MAG: C4-type zinc ribbon domain-containing protein [Desulfovibrio sp.]|jgi:predicted  nucleic acid-binding Zn-ribbon protein|nr:C4-type zinc ribbon domain-containing protein [Desulfovibrio sp.]